MRWFRRTGERRVHPRTVAALTLLLPLVSFLMKPRVRRLPGAASGMRLQKLSRRLLAR